MKKILFIVALLLAMPVFSMAQEKKSAVYFYADWCPHCQKVNAAFKKDGLYEKYDIQKLDFDKSNNKELLKNIFDEMKYTGDAGIPAIVVNGKLLVGDGPILNNFEKEIALSENKDVAFVEGVREKMESTPGSSQNIMPIIALIAAAFVDASNPCALAVLVLLLATVINAKGKNSALLSGFMFSLAIFLSYFLMGIGLYKAITAFGISLYLSLGVGILAIILSLANFKDVFWYGKGFIMEVPLSWRPKMQEIIKKATSPWSAFGIGFAVSLFLVPCASGPYVVILGMLAERVNMGSTLLLLVLYNFVFVLPMILITLGMYFFNTRMGKVEEWRKNNLRLLHAIAGAILMSIGSYLIYDRLGGQSSLLLMPIIIISAVLPTLLNVVLAIKWFYLMKKFNQTTKQTFPAVIYAILWLIPLVNFYLAWFVIKDIYETQRKHRISIPINRNATWIKLVISYIFLVSSSIFSIVFFAWIDLRLEEINKALDELKKN